MNVLSRPFYDLGTAQFAEILPRQFPTPYSTPEYVSRSVLLAGHDYFVLTDRVQNELVDHRFSWFVRRGMEFPAMHFVRAGDPNSRQTRRSEIRTEETEGIWVDGEGDSMVVISDRNDLVAKAAFFGCTVHGPGVNDLVFHSPAVIEYSDATVKFHGSAGLIRKADAGVGFALFHGRRIGVGGLSFRTTDTDLGIGGVIAEHAEPRGRIFAPRASDLIVEVTPASPRTRVYLDGQATPGSFVDGQLTIQLAPGHHVWEISERLPVPPSPRVLRTENFSQGARVIIQPVAGAEAYRIQLSEDNGATWTDRGSFPSASGDLHGLRNGRKVHVRAIAKNADHESEPGPEYPLYTSDQPLPAPDGLRIALAERAATLTWGEVLGTAKYRLYVRTASDPKYRLLYEGLERTCIDHRAGIRACDPQPATSPQSMPPAQYVVCATNGNGEGERSRATTTDPSSWRAWDPRPGEPFRRVYSYPPDTQQQPGELPRYYPE